MNEEGVGDRVRRFRRHRKLTQQALADIAGVDKGYISRLEAGEIADPGIELVERLPNAPQGSPPPPAHPRWDARETRAPPPWGAAIPGPPPRRLAAEDQEPIVRLLR